MSIQKEKQRANKGDWGYFSREKLRRLAITAGLFLLPVFVFLIGVFLLSEYQKIISVIAVVGCIPACNSMVGMIMAFTQKSLDRSEYETIHEHDADLVSAYELFLTSYEKNTFVDAVSIAAGCIVGYCSAAKADIAFAEQHIQKMVQSRGYPQVTVKLFSRMDAYLSRLDTMRAHAADMEYKEEDKRKSEGIRQVLLSLSL